MITNNASINADKTFPKYKRTFYERVIKRLLDIVISAAVIILLSPLFLLVALAVRIKLGTPIFFKQSRIGINEESFCLVKFRSMRDGKDKDGHFLPDCKRLTTFGRFLRSSSLDELPEFWNILKGDMSLIGPRPLPECYRPYFRQIRHKRDVGPRGRYRCHRQRRKAKPKKYSPDYRSYHSKSWYIQSFTHSCP